MKSENETKAPLGCAADGAKKLGFLNVDKPSGMTSSAVVNRIKRLTGLPCGHMGTLDPLASGVLPVGIGNATRLFEYFLNKQKEYIAEFTFGADSDTLDSTGELVRGGRIPTAEEIERILPDFEGEIMQVPPKYSAKNVGGRRGYDLARAGIEFELEPKKVRIDEVALLGGEGDVFRFRIRCGGGTYIRSLARDIAGKLGTKAVMSGLRRTKSGYFKIEEAVPFDALAGENIEELLIPTESVLPYETIVLNGPRAERFFAEFPLRPIMRTGNIKFIGTGFFTALPR